MRNMTKNDAIRIMKEKGLDVGAVLDVGVQSDTEELRVGFPSVKHYLFEPVEEYYTSITNNYKDVDFEIVKAAASETSGSLFLEATGWDKSGQVSHVRAVSGPGPNIRQVASISLDDFTADLTAPKPWLLKLDVDGHETAILRGATETLKNCSCLICETTLPMMYERHAIAHEAGFVLWDLADVIYYKKGLYQLDMIFVHKDQIKKHPELNTMLLLAQGFEPRQWFVPKL